MKQDQAIVYNALYQEVKMAITIIGSLGFDMTEYTEALKSINSKVKNKVKTSYVSSMAEASYINFYTDGIKELNSLKMRLESFNIYLKAANICEFVEMKLNEKLTPLELSGFVSKIIYALDCINKSNTMDYSLEEDLIKKIYQIAYATIKYEVVLNGDSELIKYIKHNGRSQDISFFNNLLLEDIEKIDLKKEQNKKIRLRYLELGENGIYSDYLDIQLLKLLLISDNNNELKKQIISNIIEITNDIKTNNDLIESTTDKYKKELANKQSNKISIKVDRLNIFKRIIAILCSFACAFGISIGIKKLAKKWSVVPFYNKTTTTYNSDTGTTDITEERDHYGNTDRKIIVEKYSETNARNKRIYEYYDVSDQEFENLEDYYKFVLNSEDIEPSERHKEKVLKPNASFGIVTLNEYVYDKQDTDKNYQDTIYALGYLIVVIAIIILEGVYKSTRSDYYKPFYISQIKGIIDSYKRLKNEKEINKESKAKLEALKNELLVLLNDNYELRGRFNKAFNDNSFLLDNPEELMKKIDEFDEESFKFVRSLDKDNKFSKGWF